MNQGKVYLVNKLDLSSKIAWCQQADLKYYTKTRDYTDVNVIGGQLVRKVPFFCLFRACQFLVVRQQATVVQDQTKVLTREVHCYSRHHLANQCVYNFFLFG